MKAIKRYTVEEEVFNSVSHGVGALLSIIGTSVMVTLAVCYGTTLTILNAVVFGISLIVLYTMSTLYHAFPFENVKKLFRVFDHASIPILIAGSYTPFCLIALQGNKKGLWVIAIVWLAAIVCVILNAVSLEKTEKVSLFLYIAMGWAAIWVIKDIVNALPTQGFWLLLAGGLSYTVGIIFYKMNKVKYMHSIWHLFVVLGSLLHYLCIVIYVMPMTYV